MQNTATEEIGKALTHKQEIPFSLFGLRFNYTAKGLNKSRVIFKNL